MENSTKKRSMGRIKPVAVVAAICGLAITALLVPLNMGGCGGVPDVTGGLSGTVSNAFAGKPQGSSQAPPQVNNDNVVNTFNGVHTGNSTVDTLGVGNIGSAGVQFVKALSLSEQDEENLGRNVVLQVTARYGVVRNPALLQYVTFVGMTVGDASPNNDFPYCFTVLNTDVVNAFSGPGGFVMITRGALERMQDESELAGVLGHEIGHINKHHGLAAVQRAGMLGAILTATKNYTRAFGQASDALGNIVLNVGFSQAEEFDADAAGVEYAAAAGYNPEGYLHFLERMAASGTGKSAPFSTHPGVSDRVGKVASEIDREGLRGKGQTLRERFLANVPHAAVNQ